MAPKFEGTELLLVVAHGDADALAERLVDAQDGQVDGHAQSSAEGHASRFGVRVGSCCRVGLTVRSDGSAS